jgi:hypothetical protein
LVNVLDKVARQVQAAGVQREDFSALRQIVAELAAAQRRTELRVEELAAAQRRTEERLGRLEEMFAAMIEAQRRTEERLGRLEEMFAEMIEAQRLTEYRLQRLTDKVARLDGRVLEITYREKASAYFGPLLRRMSVVRPHTLEDNLEARLTTDEFYDVLRLDLLVSGTPRVRPGGSEVWLAVEASTVVDEGDVARARRRAMLLQRAGYQAIPTVAGEELTEGAAAQVQFDKTVVLQDGRYDQWDEALAAWASPSPAVAE